MLIAPRFTIIASMKKKNARVRRVGFDFRATIPTTRIIYKSDCEQPGNGVIRRKRKLCH